MIVALLYCDQECQDGEYGHACQALPDNYGSHAQIGLIVLVTVLRIPLGAADQVVGFFGDSAIVR